MLEKIKAKRDAISEEIAEHQKVIDSLTERCVLYNEVIAEVEEEIKDTCEATNSESAEVKSEDGAIVEAVSYCGV